MTPNVERIEGNFGIMLAGFEGEHQKMGPVITWTAHEILKNSGLRRRTMEGWDAFLKIGAALAEEGQFAKSLAMVVVEHCSDRKFQRRALDLAARSTKIWFASLPPKDASQNGSAEVAAVTTVSESDEEPIVIDGEVVATFLAGFKGAHTPVSKVIEQQLLFLINSDNKDGKHRRKLEGWKVLLQIGELLAEKGFFPHSAAMQVVRLCSDRGVQDKALDLSNQSRDVWLATRPSRGAERSDESRPNGSAPEADIRS